VTVVTSDRELAHLVRRLGARVIASETFARSLDARRRGGGRVRPPRAGGGGGEKPPAPSPADVERWEKEFRERHRDDEGGDGN